MKRILLIGAAAFTLICSSSAMARVDVGISIGIPGIVYSQPNYYYPPVRYVAPPPVYVVPGPVYGPVYRPRYYRESFREYRGPRGHGHYKHDRDGDRGGHWRH